MIVVKGEAFRECVVAVTSDAPSSGPWDFGNQAVDVEPFEEATDGIGVPSAMGGGFGLCEEVLSDVLIAEAHQGVFAAQYGGEQGEVVGVGRVKAPIGTSLVPVWPRQCAEALMSGSGVRGCGQRLKVALVGRQRDFPIAVEVGHAFGHGIPAHHALSSPYAPAANLELPWMVDHCFDA